MKNPADAREWLSRARGMEAEVKAYEAAIEEVRERCTRTTRESGREPVQTSLKPHAYDRLAEYESGLREKIDERLAVIAEITDTIMRVPSAKQRTVLFSYYVRCRTLEQIAEDMDCSSRNVQNLRKRGEMWITGKSL